MKNILKLEEAAMFGFCVCILIFLKEPWWVFLLLLIGPDISMLGYLAGNKTGAFCYNLFHHKGIAILLFIIGYQLTDPLDHNLIILGIILLGHSSLDRMLGYGLKYQQGFKYTHLGIIGKGKSETE